MLPSLPKFGKGCFQKPNPQGRWRGSRQNPSTPNRRPFRKLSRDPDDNLFVATAMAARAKFLVSQDRDLLVLGKPYGVAIATPVQLVQLLRL